MLKTNLHFYFALTEFDISEVHCTVTH